MPPLGGATDDASDELQPQTLVRSEDVLDRASGSDRAEGHCILDRLASPLTEVRPHRVRGVANPDQPSRPKRLRRFAGVNHKRDKPLGRRRGDGAADGRREACSPNEDFVARRREGIGGLIAHKEPIPPVDGKNEQAEPLSPALVLYRCIVSSVVADRIGQRHYAALPTARDAAGVGCDRAQAAAVDDDVGGLGRAVGEL